VKENCKRISILPNLQRLKTIAIFDNLTSLSVKNLVEYYGWLNGMDIAKKLICFKVIVFQGVKFNVTI
jgi:hypothetical protein